MSRQNDLLKNTVILGIGYAVPAIVSFLTLPLYTAFLTQTEYGMYDLITILLSLVMPTMTLQIKTSVFRFLIESRESEEERKYINLMKQGDEEARNILIEHNLRLVAHVCKKYSKGIRRKWVQ